MDRFLDWLLGPCLLCDGTLWTYVVEMEYQGYPVVCRCSPSMMRFQRWYAGYVGNLRIRGAAPCPALRHQFSRAPWPALPDDVSLTWGG